MEQILYKKAMLVGYLLGDGWITVGVNGLGRNYKNIGFSGDVCDLEVIKDDIKECFGDYVGKATIRTVESTSPKYNIKGISNSICFTVNIANEFLSLGCPFGKRTEKEFSIPEWIMKGCEDTIKAFISGFYSAEGSIPAMQTNDKTPRPLEFIFTKRYSLKENSDKMANDFVYLLNKIGLDSRVKTEITYTVDKNIRYRISIDNNIHNIVKAYELLDFRYCKRKEEEKIFILKYLQYKQNLVDEIIKAKEYIMNNLDKPNKCLSEKTGFNVSKVTKIKTGVCKLSTPKSIMKYSDFKEQCCSL